jgi:hypothetical protein
MSLPLLHSPADLIRHALIALGLGSDPLLGGQWPVYATNEPSMPDNCITVYDTAAQGDGRAMVDGESFEHRGIQVRVRGADHATGYVKTYAIRRSLDEDLYGMLLTLSGATYELYNIARSTILVLGKDTPNTKRSLFTINMTLATYRLS